MWNNVRYINVKEYDWVTIFIVNIRKVNAKTFSLNEYVPSKGENYIPKIMKIISIKCCQLYLKVFSFIFMEIIKNVEFFAILIIVNITSVWLVWELNLRHVKMLVSRYQM